MSTPSLREVAPEDAGLPPCYAAARLFTCADPIDTDVELARAMAGLEADLGFRPTVVFTGVAGPHGTAVLTNPYPRPVLLAALGTDEEHVLPDMAARLAAPAPGRRVSDATGLEAVTGLDDLPVVRHRPGDAGPYVTAGVVATTRPDGGGLNLGIYRVQVLNTTECRIFMDPRTDGHRNLAEWLQQWESMPVSVFLGADPVFSLVGASRLPAEGDDYDIAARLLKAELEVAGDIPVPVSATHVINGRVWRRTADEGPFGEFKGYYVDARQSNVFMAEDVARRPGAPYPTIVAGGETGLTLMSLQNEYLMFAHLTDAGFAVRSVRYPLTARGNSSPSSNARNPVRNSSPRRCASTSVRKSPFAVPTWGTYGSRWPRTDSTPRSSRITGRDTWKERGSVWC